MKVRNLFLALVMGLAIVGCNTASDGSYKDYSTKSEVDSVSYLLGINYGSFLKNYNFGTEINFAQVVEGMKDFIKSEGDMNDPEFVNQFKISPEEIDRIFNSYLEKKAGFAGQQAKAEGEKFLEKNKMQDGVQVTESGLQYIIEDEGGELHAGPADAVRVHYKGTLVDGTVFDECPADEEPIALQLSNVIAGWTEGIQLVGEGGKIKLFLPSELAYGENGAGPIAPNSVLIFDVEVVEVLPAEVPAEDAEE